LVVQLVAQAAPLHAKAPHDVAVPWHAPAPLQVPEVTEPPEHCAHAVPEGHSSHPPPWHLPSVPHDVAGVAAQTPRGSAVPSATVAQVPFAAPVRAAEQASHELVHAVAQQTPSTQKPLAHASGALHAAPTGCFAVQIVPAQKKPAAQEASLVQAARQLVAPQTYGLHAATPPPWLQPPAASHVLAAVAAPFAHEATPHVVPAA
jgi:hypothetical protein